LDIEALESEREAGDEKGAGEKTVTVFEGHIA
jgi:hypothetical protein